MTDGIVALTRQQFFAFVNDRLDGAGPCRVQDDLAFATLAGTAVLPNARRFLMALDGGGTRLTDRGNLNRKFVETLMDRLQWQGSDVAEIRSMCKVINEQDFAPAAYLHGICRLAGLVRITNKVLEPTRKGRTLLPEDQAGRLQALLFRTTFAKYDLAYLDRFHLREVFAPQISLILYLIGKFCTDWSAPGPLMRSVTAPTPELIEPQYPDLLISAFEARVLKYLWWFGLLEQTTLAANDEWRQPRLYRKTELYDRMLRFEELG